MKTLKDYILGTKRQLSNDNYILTEKLKLNKKSKAVEHIYHPKNKGELRSIIEELLRKRGKDADLNDIDTSAITDMSNLFYNLDPHLDPHNIDISQWNVSNVKDMHCMFWACENFTSDLSSWNVSNVEKMNSMFFKCNTFNSDLSGWDVSNVKDMAFMFWGCEKFTSDLSSWDVSNAKDIYAMFAKCTSLKNKPSWYK